MLRHIPPSRRKESYLYSVAKLFLINNMEETKYIPIISERKRTRLLEEPLPTLEIAKKNCTKARMLGHGNISNHDQSAESLILQNLIERHNYLTQTSILHKGCLGVNSNMYGCEQGSCFTQLYKLTSTVTLSRT